MAEEKKQTQETKSVKAAKKVPGVATQNFLKIAEIKDDLVVLKNGGIRAVLKASSINFNLKSEDEQNAIIFSYQNFLNTLDFPLQILVRSRKLDVDEYLENLKKKGEKQTNQLLQRQTFEYIEYIKSLIEYADIMTKEFYVVVPYDPYRAQKVNLIQKFFKNLSPKDTVADVKRRSGEFEQLTKGLNQRLNTVITGLENCGLKVNQLPTKELIELFYNVYNPLTSRTHKAKETDDLDLKSKEDIV